MKRALQVAAILLLAIGVYFAFSPYVALRGLRSALQSGDPVVLEDRVDFPRLRENLKAQLNVAMLKNLNSELSANPFSALALGLASKLVESMVDSFVTPTGIASLARGEKLDTGSIDPRSASSTGEPFANGRVTREALDRFSVWVPNDKGEEARFVFHRYGIKWKLTGIVIPLADVSRSYGPSIPDSSRPLGPHQAAQPDPRSQEFLANIAVDINRSVPVMIDQETELMSAVGAPGMLIYNYRLVRYPVTQVDHARFAAGAKERVKESACGRPETRDSLLKKGVTLRYTYFDRDKKHITTIDVAPSDCGF